MDNTETVKLKGVILAVLAPCLWSISGIAGELLFKKYNFSSEWLLSTRTLVSGLILCLIVKFGQKKSLLEPFKEKKDVINMILFGLIAMYGTQYTYFRAIELSNVSFATILQFTAPFFIFIYESIKKRKIPEASTVILLILTGLGVVFIATKGNFSNLSASTESLFVGILSAIMIAFYTIQPRELLKKYGSIRVVGLGMLIGATLSNIFHPIWNVVGDVNKNSLLQVFIVVIIGTALAYLIFISSLKYVSSSLAGILTAFEPVLAAILSVFIFGLRFSFIELVGFALVFGSVFLLERRL